MPSDESQSPQVRDIQEERFVTDNSADLDRLQGTWAITTLEVDGKPLSPHDFAAARLIVEGDHFTALGMGAAYSGTLKLDTSVTPRALDMRFDDGTEKGNTNLCIYELSDDVWKLCVATRGSVRPTTFTSQPGSGIAVETLERDHNSTE
jgi:uncharacterized protein (TIGR03067 family)